MARLARLTYHFWLVELRFLFHLLCFVHTGLFFDRREPKRDKHIFLSSLGFMSDRTVTPNPHHFLLAGSKFLSHLSILSISPYFLMSFSGTGIAHLLSLKTNHCFTLVLILYSLHISDASLSPILSYESTTLLPLFLSNIRYGCPSNNISCSSYSKWNHMGPINWWLVHILLKWSIQLTSTILCMTTIYHLIEIGSL